MSALLLFLLSIQWSQVLGFVTLTTLLWAGINRYVRPWIVTACKVSKAIIELPEKLDTINHELKPNGGGSLRDAVNRIEAGLARHQVTTQAVIEHQKLPLFELLSTGELVFASKQVLESLKLSLPQATGFGWMTAFDHTQRHELQEEIKDAALAHRDFSFVAYDLEGSSWRVRGTVARNSKSVFGFVCCIEPYTLEAQ